MSMAVLDMTIQEASVYIEQIDDEISRLSTQTDGDVATLICQLRTQRNTLTPIGHLPLELLAEIFRYYHYACEARKWRSRMPSQNQLVKELAAILHTCSLWQAVAADCPFLWLLLDSTYTSTDIVSWLLRRGGSHPVWIRAARRDLAEGVLPLLLMNRHRVQHLEYFNDSPSAETLMKLLHGMLQGADIKLRTLVLSGLQEHGLVAIPLLKSSMSHVRVLDLGHTPFPCGPLPLLANLHTLRLYMVKLDNGVGLLDILAALSCTSKHLHTLIIEYVESRRSSSATQTIQLDTVKKLHFCSNLTTTAILLEAVKFPADCCFSCSCHPDSPGRGTTWTYFEACVALLHAPMETLGSTEHPSSIQHAYISLNSDGVFFSADRNHFRATQAAHLTFRSSDEPTPWPIIRLSLSIPWSRDPDRVGARIFPKYFQQIPWSGIQHLKISLGQEHRSMTGIVILFARCLPSLLHLCSLWVIAPTDPYFEWLMPNTIKAILESLTPQSDAQLPTPSLRSLKLDRIHTYTDEADGGSLSSIIPAFRDVLRCRAERNVALQTLALVFNLRDSFNIAERAGWDSFLLYLGTIATR